jgi:hypothetical protein
MEIPKIEEVLSEPSKWLVSWVTQWAGLDINPMFDVAVTVEYRMSVADAIRYHRRLLYEDYENLGRKRMAEASGRDVLLDFLVTHWAELVRKED